MLAKVCSSFGAEEVKRWLPNRINHDMDRIAGVVLWPIIRAVAT